MSEIINDIDVGTVYIDKGNDSTFLSGSSLCLKKQLQQTEY